MASPVTLEPPRGAYRSGRRRASAAPLYPLSLAYEQAGLAVPDAEVIEPRSIPSPYHSLLVHEGDMTFTLERHWGGRVVLRVLSVFSRRKWYFRRVLLVHEYSGRPVEMGAIRVNVDAFPARVRRQVLMNEVPLGRVLRDGDVDYVSRPKVYLRVTPNTEMMGVFWMREPLPLYGRQTEVLLAGRKIGDIVEILPPA